MARFIATQPIYFGGALAFAAGAQVPEDHVERFGYADAGWVRQVDDDHRGDAPDLVPAPPDNTPPPIAPPRFVDEATARVEQAQRDFAAAQASGGTTPVADEPPAEPSNQAEPSDSTPKTSRTTTKAKPATGDTTAIPVKES